MGVVAGAGTPTGSVTFLDGTKSLGTGTLNGGVATLVVKNLTLGSHSVNASYAVTANFANSSSTNPASLVVSPDDSSTVVTAASSTSVVHQFVTFSATVTPAAPGTATPTGTVTFFDGTQALGTKPVGANGIAILAISTLAQGQHSITATYNPANANFNTSTSLPWTQTVLYSSGITITGKSPASPVYGQTQTFTASVFSKTAGSVGTPTGTVNFFYDGANPLGTGTLSGGVTTVTFVPLTAGTHHITAQYVPDASSTFVGSGTPTALLDQVGQAATTTTLDGPTTTIYGAPISFTATVIPAFSGGNLPSKSVTFKDGTTVIGTATLNGGVAILPISTLPAGATPQNITATYTGDANYKPSAASNIVAITVGKSDTSMTLTSSADTGTGTAASVYSQPVTFSASVTPINGGGGTPDGQVSFFVDGATKAAATVAINASGIAPWVVSTMAIGTHTITATYMGSKNYNAAPSSPSTDTETLTVTQDTSEVTVSSSGTPSFFGSPVTLTATVSATAPGIGKPGGTVTFLVDGSPTGGATNVPINSNGLAVFVAKGLAAGPHEITATYVPDGSGNFSGNTSPSFEQDVVQQTIDKLVAATNPAVVRLGSFFSIIVKAEDAAGNPVVADSNAPVTLTLLMHRRAAPLFHTCR